MAYRANVFDSMGNYLYCQECVVKAVKVSKQRLARQRKVKRNAFKHPIKTMKKSEVNDQNLSSFVVMTEGVDVCFKAWWKTIPPDHDVDVRFPHDRHGLSGRTSNNTKSQAKLDFLQFIDENSQPNGWRLDSKNPTHYLLPKFTTISMPKSDPNYHKKLQTSLTAEFNRIQTELGKSTVSDFSVLSWLKNERPKYAIYPHQVDYCDFCAIRKKIQAKQQLINRLRQSGGGIEEELKQAEFEKEKSVRKRQAPRGVTTLFVVL